MCLKHSQSKLENQKFGGKHELNGCLKLSMLNRDYLAGMHLFQMICRVFLLNQTLHQSKRERNENFLWSEIIYIRGSIPMQEMIHMGNIAEAKKKN